MRRDARTCGGLCGDLPLCSPLQIGDELDVTGMGPAEECEREIVVCMRWQRDGPAVPLTDLAVTYVDEETRQAVDDWLYRVNRGYRF